MDALGLVLGWSDAHGAPMFKPEDMVGYKLVGDLLQCYPMLPMYITKVPTEVKGVVRPAVQVTHSMEDVLRRYLQVNDLRKMAWGARVGTTRTDAWHGRVYRSSHLYTESKLPSAIPGTFVFIGDRLVITLPDAHGVLQRRIGVVSSIFTDDTQARNGAGHSAPQ